jgi:hypothetical protein
MASYPVVLYPRLIAEFRKSNSLHGSGEKSLVTLKSAARPATQFKHLSPGRVFVQRLLGTALVVLGLAKAGSPLGLLALVAGGIALLTPSIQRFLLRRKASESKGVTHSLPPRDLENVENDLKAYLSSLSETMRGKVLQPDGVTDAPVGASEKAFGQVLEKFFPGRVHAQLRLPIPNWDGAYSTDFTISFPEIGIWIDCEIDEPYDYKTGQPTHCTDDERDRNRNSFFLNSNWIVVRFSEEQVVRYSESCCRELVSVVRRVTGMEMYSKGLADIPMLKPTSMWTSRQAKKMAKAKYRDKYLKLAKLKT